MLAWLTHGLLEADIAAADSSGAALRLARGMLDWFSALQPTAALTLPLNRTLTLTLTLTLNAES